ncbi:DUF1413 domain-containing protein [Mammaliicoccus sciuri]|uniref:DUF1413 domain-containing protein n=1 Tax=Mammaliicoccus sciuri TaxID=1296 RepID=UPI001E4710E0|nr:DUF1413 domain-containing protein [Mammaliicoccus sciuri]MCD8898502.1 single-stranded DNA-binding protein [Mammaliicoccus sciuri]
MVTLSEVIKRAQMKKVGETFEIKGLFTDQDWGNQKNVTVIGKDFCDEVKNGQVKGVTRKCIKSNNHSVYVRR